MGCIQSNDYRRKKDSSHPFTDHQKQHKLGFCCHQETTNASLTMCNDTINTLEIDLSHFTKPRELLGIGGFGLVRKIQKLTGHDRNKIYAMKSINKGMVLTRQSGVTAVMTELKTLIILNDYEGICRLHYAFQDSHHLYMIMDYASAGDLRFNLKKCPGFRFTERLSKIFILQTLLALEFCHSRNILHRDVKPENLLLTSSGRVMLSDFGIAKILPDIEKCQATSGTHGYMGPEVYTDDHTHGTTFDWFCAGITLHEFLTGRRPYEATRLQKYYSTPLRDPLELDVLPRVNVSSNCIHFVTSILNPNRFRRLGGIRGMKEILQHPWMMEDPHISEKSLVRLVRRELPHFDHHMFYNQDPLSRMSINRDDVIALMEAHQEHHDISEEMQRLFQNFEYNTKANEHDNTVYLDHSIYYRYHTHPLVGRLIRMEQQQQPSNEYIKSSASSRDTSTTFLPPTAGLRRESKSDIPVGNEFAIFSRGSDEHLVEIHIKDEETKEPDANLLSDLDLTYQDCKM